ncbi:peroxisome proliferator-activated receptor gamma coactivator-related protein 1 isoform X1 [Hippocampus zosterae]|uniref:peroxisome proliferator-activated receptor gamma coactivator-related protein 1 isoform X1 n=1 Tax=Hippocampus zosterae TaxID=109293 RepID=UPI00223C9CB1|nr:peroxisome proliferator-activated receptor gamma coactivator-related protein 1 isoform X1 [Hippocampus zosterae]
MAVRWGTGEENLTTCNMDFFPLDTLGTAPEMCSGGPSEALQSCLDPSILSIFDTPYVETKGLDEDGEATLLTALADILDNMDDENLSPFDMLPESDLMSGQGKEHSPLRRFLCLPQSSPEKDLFCSRPLSSGKNLHKMRQSLQRSDGEEEDAGSLTLSPMKPSLPSDCTLEDLGGLNFPFPVTIEQNGGDDLSVNLRDLVKHMHPYCMTICMEDDEGTQMLPAGGILLEVVDQGENGEPILAVQDLPVPLPIEESPNNKLRAEDEEEVASDSSEHIVVDDDDDDEAFPQAPVRNPNLCSDGKECNKINKQKEATIARMPSHRKRKKKCKKHCPPVEGRVLRSAAARNKIKELPQKSEKRRLKEQKKNKVPKATAGPITPSVEPMDSIPQPCESAEIPTMTAESSVKAVAPFVSPQPTGLLKSGVSESPALAIYSQQPDKMSQQVFQAPDELSSQSSPMSSSNPAAAPNFTLTVDEPLPPETPAAPEPKPKSLSLAEYRQLRLQKKPVAVDKQGDNSTKWPSLPEPPRELLPIPCLPQPSPRDPRWPTFQAAKKSVEVKPAWQPRGPCAPPTPEALLVPPAYMVASPKKPANAVTAQPKVSSQSTDKGSKLSEDKTEVTERTPQLVKTTTETIQCTSAATVSVPSPLQTTLVGQNVIPCSTPSSKNHNTSTKALTTKAESCSTPFLHPMVSSLASKLVLEPKSLVTAQTEAPKAKSPTQELIESFTTEMGIEAADLTSLLEQFEETQVSRSPYVSSAREQQSIPEVCGRAAAVGNSSVGLPREKTVVERVTDLSSPAALTPPATPPHQMWKPLAPVALLGKARATESSKSNPSKAIQIEARPLTSAKFRAKPTAAPATVPYSVLCMDHDYCLPSRDASSAGEAGNRWNVKQQITIKPIRNLATATTGPPCIQETTYRSNPNPQASSPTPEALNNGIEGIAESSVLETPEASPARQESESAERILRKKSFERSYRWRPASCSPSPKRRGRKRRPQRSPSVSSSIESDSHSSRSRSRSHLPSKKRFHHSRSRSRSSSSSRSSSRSSVSRSPPRRRKYSYSSSHSGSWSRSRSRSQSPQRQVSWRKKRSIHSPSYRRRYGYAAEDVKSRKDKAIEERRVVYIGRIRGTMTQRELRERFSYFGEVEDCTLHFREQGDNYGFVTYYDTKDAFTAIENGNKLRKADELPFDLCFGGRRQFCKTTYADLDSNRDYDPASAKGKVKTLDFDTLLKQAQRSLKR